jgi:AraC-like DNA-binding protein
MPVNKYQEFIPHTVLQDHVKRFWIMEKEYTAEDSIEEVIPDACIELILNFGSTYVQLADSTPRPLPNVCLIGLLSKPLILQASGVVKIVSVRFFAWGALPFLKNEVRRDSTMNVELDDEWQLIVSKIATKVQQGNYQRGVEEIEDFLIGKRLNTLFKPQQLRASAKLLYRTKGKFRVAELADYLNLSMRQVQRQFDEATGVSPKTLARTIRFEAIQKHLMLEPDTKLTDLAYEFGYTDQAHFINDFKAFMNKTPGEFAEEMQKFQEMFHDNNNVVFLQSPPSMPDYTVDNQKMTEVDDYEEKPDILPDS